VIVAGADPGADGAVALLDERAREDLSPALYDAMCRAIEAAHQVDEVKDVRDKALALEVYLRQARNFQAEMRAIEIRLRAERKAGELLSLRDKAKGAREPGTNRGTTPRPNGGASTLDELGISEKQSRQWQKLADVSQEQFEAAFTDPDKRPTTAGIIAAANPTPRPPVEDDALWLWGRLLDFERNGLLTRRYSDVCQTMLPHMRDTVQELAPKVARWLREETK
jgi:hypothetical protein